MPDRYARLEIERRWLVDLAQVGSLDGLPCRRIDDLYLTGTRLRLRTGTAIGEPPAFKFCRKEPRAGSSHAWITNLYLAAGEHEVLEFHNPTTRFCKLWFTADVIGETVLDVTGPHARCEFITQGAFLSRDEISKLTVFPAALQSQYWIDRAAGFAAPRYLGIRAMEFW